MGSVSRSHSKSKGSVEMNDQPEKSMVRAEASRELAVLNQEGKLKFNNKIEAREIISAPETRLLR